MEPALIEQPGFWRSLPELGPSAPALRRELKAIQMVAEGLAGTTPLMMTIFSPLTLAFKLAGQNAIHHLRQSPGELHRGLQTLTRTTTEFALAALSGGADSLFFATQLASHLYLTPGEYAEFGERYDLEVLRAVEGLTTITVLHLHGKKVFFELASTYPVHGVSWHDQETYPSLWEARTLTNRALVTGLDRRLLEQGPVDAIEAQLKEAVAQTKGRGLILAPSCVIPVSTPLTHLCAVRAAVRERKL
jgi:uroporphyrinogen decarboxylase